jgi:pyruvate carboxylase subunit B
VKFKIQIDGTEHEIEASPMSVIADGEAHETKVGSPAPDRRTVQVGDKSFEVRIAENCAETGIFVLEIAGERIPVTVSEVVRTASRATGTAAAADEGKETRGVPADVKEGVWAPVPGKIVNVMVKPGDKVDEGAPVVVLEAMKMENELHAPVKGTVTAVLVKKGDQAEKGQLLVAFE